MYPGPIQFSMFLKAFTNEMESPVFCRSPYAPLDEPLFTDGYSECTVLVNYFGMAILSYRSVTSFESELFGSAHRGYLIAFRYTVWNGPHSSFLPLYSEPCLFDYTVAHQVNLVSCGKD